MVVWHIILRHLTDVLNDLLADHICPECFLEQNDTGNRYSPTVIAAAITSQTNKAKLPTHIALSAPDYGLPRDSVVLLEQIRTLDKRRLRERMGRVDGELMERIDAAIAVSFGLQSTQLV